VEGQTDAKHILVLMAEAGFGHRSAARAVAEALRELYGADCQIDVVNPLDDARTPAFLRNSQADYDRAVREMPELYRLGYEASDAALPSAIFEQAMVVCLFEVMRELLHRYQPDAIVTTYQSYLAPLDAVFALEQCHIPLLTVITDLATVHRLWFNPVSDWCLVPTQQVYDLALDYGLAPEKVRVTGIPVYPALAREQRQPAAIRAELGWCADVTTVLAVGSKRVQHLTETLHILNHSGLPLQLALVAGGDDGLYHQWQNTTLHHTTHVHNYVDNMPALMHAADCIVCKAGGLTVTEALACGLPLLLVDVIEGQETGNADYVLQGGAGEWAHDPIQALETMCHWLEHDDQLLSERAENARRLGRPRAAYDVAELTWQVAQRGPQHRSLRMAAHLPKLVDLLDRFGVPWKDDSP